MPATGPRGTARGRPLSIQSTPAPEVGADFRCAVAAEQRHDDVAGTATHLHAFLLVEHHGPWGTKVPRDTRFPQEVRDHLTLPKSVKVLMARRHHRAHRGSTYRVFLAVPRRRLLLTSTFEDPRELLAVDLAGIAEGRYPDWTPVDGPILGVCTHGRHDVCCAERGRPVAATLSGSHPAETWEVSHVGGDRFGANMVVLPDGLYYGRMDPATASDVADLHAEGRLDLTRLRGRSTYPMPVQHAEIALLRHLGDDRLDALTLVGRDGETSVFDHHGDRWAVTVRRSETGPARLTCVAERLNPVPVLEVVSIERVQDS